MHGGAIEARRLPSRLRSEGLFRLWRQQRLRMAGNECQLFAKTGGGLKIPQDSL
jgi:hypothetical protein